MNGAERIGNPGEAEVRGGDLARGGGKDVQNLRLDLPGWLGGARTGGVGGALWVKNVSPPQGGDLGCYLLPRPVCKGFVSF